MLHYNKEHSPFIIQRKGISEGETKRAKANSQIHHGFHDSRRLLSDEDSAKLRERFRALCDRFLEYK